ncbi:MAG TPA: A/G-specific adenine glycosylase [Anaerolineales bacterium]|nr:A/G-specific adenine glycosylase [Anaerolineales bacterium]
MKRLASRLLNWYDKNKRVLPWRDHPDPYAIWVSEIMLQQTRVEAVFPYFQRWMHLFPDVRALAVASEQDVLNAWEGLGYYSRARNLHKAAKVIADQYNGELPRDLDELLKLPGIGRYTAGAIASIAFQLDVPALDGNIKRVYSRIFDMNEPVDSPAGEKILWSLAEEYLPTGRAGDYNQALMDLGALICIPRNPRCLICPVMKLCEARRNGTQDQRPVKTPKKDVPHYVHAAAVIIKKGKVLLAQRPSNGLLGGMWEFPNGRVNGDPAKELAKVLKTGYNLRLRVKRSRSPNAQNKKLVGIVQHGYSHFKVTVHAYECELISMSEDRQLKWVPLAVLDDYPMGRIDRQIAQKLVNKTVLENASNIA